MANAAVRLSRGVRPAISADCAGQKAPLPIPATKLAAKAAGTEVTAAYPP